MESIMLQSTLHRRCAVLVFFATLVLSLGQSPKAALAHAGGAPVAWPSTPSRVGELADQTFELQWIDSDTPISTGTATIDWYYTDRMPRTFPIGVVPPDLEGTPIKL